MLRLRRYRIFVAFAVLTVLAFYKFGGARKWEAASALTPDSVKHGAESLKEQVGLKPEPEKLPPKAAEHVTPQSPEHDPLDIKVPAAEHPQSKIPPPPVESPRKPAQHLPSSSKALKPLPTATPEAQTDKDVSTIPTPPLDARPNPHVEIPVEHGQGRLEVSPIPEASPIYWEQQKENFPVTSTIQLPQGTPKAIPKIQAPPKKLSAAEEEDRKAKLAAITDAFRHAWRGYKAKAWGKDELAPISGGSKDPFGGWGATLVDSLDTLWIMGLKDEFEDAVKAVQKIEFTTTSRQDIPIFETTIRYLGGLIAAYDLSGGKYRGLLDKAVELADVMMGAFDTPNRMPVTYYYWRPTFASQPHRAHTRVVLAEIGSLSLEFTRLAQITKEPRYYDAVARITDALEEYQNRTRVPGMWPTYLDASGCKRPGVQSPELIPGEVLGVPVVAGQPVEAGQINETLSTSNDLGEMKPLEKPDPIFMVTKGASRNEVESGDGSSDASSHFNKRQLEAPILDEPLCEPQGLQTHSEYVSEQYAIGGMADSTYEYLPKMYLLLGGREEKYRTMYESAIEVVKAKLLFRPMVPGGEDILFAGAYDTGYSSLGSKPVPRLDAEGGHLTCFAGGMFALGAKIFEREGDLDIAAKLTEGCVWAYNATSTGIMPEQFMLAPCEDRGNCKWNESRWWDLLDPYQASRENAYREQMAYYSQRVKAMETPAPAAAVQTEGGAVTQFTASPAPHLEDTEIKKHKRQLMDDEDAAVDSPSLVAADPDPPLPAAIQTIEAIYKPEPPPTHEEYVKSRITEERLPKGFVQIRDRRYILRPEAIESVFYMHRITAHPHWRAAGWKMFSRIQHATRTEFGNSAIDDVTKNHPEQTDTMESFWLAETLKYFWLLFADEGEVDLDQWVLNTEAHPFRREMG